MSDTSNQFEFPNIESGRYRLIQVLGSGAAGVVFKVQDTKLDKVVAIKKLHGAATEKEASRFHREAKLAGSLSHPNVLVALDFGLTDKMEPYLVLDFVEGESLAKQLKSGRRLSDRRMLDLFIQVANGLAHAHKRNVVHRDVKPSNLMVIRNDDGSDTVKIVDFGLAKSIEDENQYLTSADIRVGTPRYMSPEQIRGETLDGRCDVYSFGCVMYQVVAGKSPFSSNDMLELLDMHLNSPVLPLKDACSRELPPSLDRVIENCLSKDKNDRYSADQLAVELERIMTGEKPSGQDLNEDAESTSAAKKKIAIPPAVIPVSIVVLVLSLIAYAITAILAEPTGTSTMSHAVPQILQSNQFAQPGYYSSEPGATDQSLATFAAKHKNAVSLVLVDSDITSSGLGCLSDVNLKILKLGDMPVTVEGFENISKIKSLKELYFGASTIDPKGVACLAQLPLLNKLTLSHLEVNPEILKGVATIKTLTYLQMDGVTGLATGDIRYIKPLSKLRTLVLDFSDLADEGLEDLVDLPLVYLSMDVTNVGDKNLMSAAKMKKLVSIKANTTTISSNAAELVKSMRNDLKLDCGNPVQETKQNSKNLENFGIE